MSVSYLEAQKKRVRVTLDLTVFNDFDPRQIDWERMFNLEPAESCDVYVEDFDVDWWHSAFDNQCCYVLLYRGT